MQSILFMRYVLKQPILVINVARYEYKQTENNNND